MGVARALLDTSLVIGLARGEISGDSLADPPEALAVSAVTLAGLHHGVLVAPAAVLAQRLQTLRLVEESCPALPVEERVAMHYGRIAADARRLRGRRIGLGDGLIAATAIVHQLPLYTRDRDFDGLNGVRVILI